MYQLDVLVTVFCTYNIRLVDVFEHVPEEAN